MSGLPVGPRRRELVGDNLKGKPVPKTCLVPERLFPCFKSLFQGDHLGVEFALRSHEVLLQQHGLLDHHTRVEGHRNFPAGSRWDALVIDDYFCLGSERLNAPASSSFASESLQRAHQAYESDQLLGSPEKDIWSETCLKAAGAEISSRWCF